MIGKLKIASQISQYLLVLCMVIINIAITCNACDDMLQAMSILKYMHAVDIFIDHAPRNSKYS